MLKRVLVVDSDATAVRALSEALEGLAHIERCTDFREARTRLRDTHPGVLITNLRLGAYSGLHLVHLAAVAVPRTRSFVYMDSPEDLFLARMAQEAGGFYESKRRLPNALPAYAHAELPDHDRRNPALFDRRRVARGGRRMADLAVP